MSKASTKRQEALRKKFVSLMKESGAILLADDEHKVEFSLPNRKVLPMNFTMFKGDEDGMYCIFIRAGKMFTNADIPAAKEVLKGLPFCDLNPFNLKWNILDLIPESALKEVKRRINFLMEGDGELILPLERLLA